MERRSPALLLVELVAHVFRELLELALGLGIVGVDDEVLEMPEAPAEVLKPLTLLEVAGDFGADLAPMTTREKDWNEKER